MRRLGRYPPGTGVVVHGRTGVVTVTETFETLSTAALLGTARSAPATSTLHTADAATALTGDPASRLLAAAALESAFLTAATLPTVRTLPSPAPDDDRLTLPPAAAERLRGLLVVRSPLLPEWFALAERFRAPHEIVVDLLWFRRARHPTPRAPAAPRRRPRPVGGGAQPGVVPPRHTRPGRRTTLAARLACAAPPMVRGGAGRRPPCRRSATDGIVGGRRRRRSGPPCSNC